MAHGYPTGLTRLYDENGNPVEVVLQQSGTYALATHDQRTRGVLEEIRDALAPEKKDPWAVRSPWKGQS